MSRKDRSYVCQTCGAAARQWAGRCASCGAWNSLVEEAAGPVSARRPGRALDLVPLDAAPPVVERRATGIAEFDRVLGGGLVPGSCVLIGGDPGIGKSTLLLQAVAKLAARGLDCLYVTGEEAVSQIAMRARRLGMADAPVALAAATAAGDIAATLSKRGEVAVVDSIQTVHLDGLDSAAGSVAQVRASAQVLIEVARRRGAALLLVGHVTKDGAIAGPRVLEHMVDTVLYFEGERGHHFRILRAVKNRHGATDEIGVFEMTDRGLGEVANPSELFLGDRRDGRPLAGTAVFAGVEGARPLLVEIQALVGPPAAGSPRRAVVGWDASRLAMVLAVLEARAGVALGGRDIYLNVAGGLRISEPAADLAAAAALVSSLEGAAAPPGSVWFGEIGLTGEVRPVAHGDARLREAQKLGFEAAVIPSARQPPGGDGLRIETVSHVAELAARLGTGRRAARRARS